MVRQHQLPPTSRLLQSALPLQEAATRVRSKAADTRLRKCRLRVLSWELMEILYAGSKETLRRRGVKGLRLKLTEEFNVAFLVPEPF